MATENLIARFRNGDRAAFHEIVEVFQADVRTLIACNGIALSDVDDIAQETFLHVYQSIGQFEIGTDFRAWIRTIALYKTKAFLEARKRELRNRSHLLQHYLLERTGRMSDDLKHHRVGRLARCLDRLGQHARDLIKKRYAGVPLARMADELGKSVPAVKMMLLRIRHQLRRCVEGQP